MSNLKPRLVVRRGPNPDHVYMLNNETTIVGREPINDAMFPDPEVSRRHARIVNQNGDYFIEDLNSTNGTFINGRRISEITQITSGDIIDFGETVRVVFELQSSRDPNRDQKPAFQDPRVEGRQDVRSPQPAGGPPNPAFTPTPRSNEDFYAQLEPSGYKQTTAALEAQTGQYSAQPGGFLAPRSWQNWIIGAGCMMILIMICMCGVLLWYLDAYQPDLLYGFLPDTQ